MQMCENVINNTYLKIIFCIFSRVLSNRVYNKCSYKKLLMIVKRGEEKETGLGNFSDEQVCNLRK
jgi:hypothetical protein